MPSCFPESLARILRCIFCIEDDQIRYREIYHPLPPSPPRTPRGYFLREEESTKKPQKNPAELIAPRPSPSPSPQISYKNPFTDVSKNSSAPSLFSSNPSPSPQISRKNPSTVENYRRTPTEVSKNSPIPPLSSSQVSYKNPFTEVSHNKPSPSSQISHKNPPPSPQISNKNPSPSPQISNKNPSPSPVENYRRVPTEASKNSPTPSLSSSQISYKVSLKNPSPSPVENYRWVPTEVSKVSSTPSLSSSEQKSPSYYLAVPLQEILERFPEKSTPTPKVSSPLSPSLKAFRASTSSSLSPSPKAFRASTSLPSKKVDLPRYEIPEHLKAEIKQDIVPSVLKRPLNPLNYADYFATLLYAEDFYCEKWSDYLLSDVTLKLTSKESFLKVPNLTRTLKDNKNWTGEEFVEFEMDSVPERRPYLLSRDYVRLQPSGPKVEPFQGVLFRVVKSKTVLAEFEDDFHRQHSPSKKYNVSFSFNRVCLKRSHQAISATMNPLLSSILFPDPSSRIDSTNSTSNMFSSARGTEYGQFQVTSRIINIKDPVPYLIEGPLSEASPGSLSSTGTVIKETMLQICRTSPCCRILVCAPKNRTCDALTSSLLKDIPNSKLFRANAAFRDYDQVPDDILSQCSYEHECFTCPSLSELQEFMIVTSTFISTFRLYAAGIAADHFTHIFLVDASSATEPEAVVALANLVSKKTVIVVAGSSKDMPFCVRSDIARRNGLKRSFFQRLLERNPYSTNDPKFISRVT